MIGEDWVKLLNADSIGAVESSLGGGVWDESNKKTDKLLFLLLFILTTDWLIWLPRWRSGSVRNGCPWGLKFDSKVKAYIFLWSTYICLGVFCV